MILHQAPSIFSQFLSTMLASKYSGLLRNLCIGRKKALGIECIHEKLNRVYLTYILCWGALFQISWIVQDQALKSNQFRVSAQIFVFQNSWISQDRILKSNQVTMISIRGEIPRHCTKHPCHSASPTFFVPESGCEGFFREKRRH